jgi:uncharacterized membrane protein YeaQ/YmgE (transglycosylase-associated protein family)
MIAMGFHAFVALLVLGFIGSLITHAVLRYRVLAGWDGFLSTWILAWVGAWLGSPVLGHWGPHMVGIYIIPALIGAFASSFFLASAFRAVSGMLQSTRSTTGLPPSAAASQVEMRKAS